MLSGPADLPGLVYWRAAVNSSGENSPEMLHSLDVVVLQRSAVSWRTAQEKSRFIPVYAPFFTTCAAIAFAVTGHVRGARSDLPVKLFKVLHAIRLVCEKSMEWTASFQRWCLFLPRVERRAVAESLASGP